MYDRQRDVLQVGQVPDALKNCDMLYSRCSSGSDDAWYLAPHPIHVHLAAILRDDNCNCKVSAVSAGMCASRKVAATCGSPDRGTHCSIADSDPQRKERSFDFMTTPLRYTCTRVLSTDDVLCYL